MNKIRSLQDLKRAKEKGLNSIYPDRIKIAVGAGTCGLTTGAAGVLQEIKKEVKEKSPPTMIAMTGCMGFCQKEPLVDVLRPGWPRITYCEMTAEKARRVVHELSGRQNSAKVDASQSRRRRVVDRR